MTTEELRALIESDPEALEMAEAGNDTGCAARLSEIAPKVPAAERYIHAMDIMSAFADPTIGADAWDKLVAASANSGVIAIAVSYMKPDSQRGLNIADSRSQAMCNQLQQLRVWTTQQRDTIKDLRLVSQIITPDQVSEAMAPTRIMFREEAEGGQ